MIPDSEFELFQRADHTFVLISTTSNSCAFSAGGIKNGVSGIGGALVSSGAMAGAVASAGVASAVAGAVASTGASSGSTVISGGVIGGSAHSGSTVVSAISKDGNRQMFRHHLNFDKNAILMTRNSF